MIPRPGTFTRPEPGLRRIIAPNPSPMTHWGTNSYLVGEGHVALIDPGPADADHFAAIQAALDPGEVISHILVTHSHLDHSPLAAPVADHSGAPIYAFGNSGAGRSAVMQRLTRDGLTGGGEGVDPAFAPHEVLADGAVLDGPGWQMTALWTPGHFGNHMCFAWNGVLFTGDHVMGWASSLVSPPDGDLTDFMTSTGKLQGRTDRLFYPGHGAAIDQPQARLTWLINHRLSREAQILAALATQPASVAELTRAIYTDVAPALFPAARRNVFAHLIDLAGKSRVVAEPALSTSARFALI